MTAKECGKFISVLRKEKNLTQKQLADEINVSDKAISRWETGKGYPDVSSLVALSDFFDLSVNEILAGKKADSRDIADLADDNIISMFKESDEERRIRRCKMLMYTSILIIVLAPTLIVISKEVYGIIATQIQSENIFPSIAEGFVAVLLFVSGLIIKRGNINIIHSYHYKNVTDYAGYSKEMGNSFFVYVYPRID